MHSLTSAAPPETATRRPPLFGFYLGNAPSLSKLLQSQRERTINISAPAGSLHPGGGSWPAGRTLGWNQPSWTNRGRPLGETEGRSPVLRKPGQSRKLCISPWTRKQPTRRGPPLFVAFNFACCTQATWPLPTFPSDGCKSSNTKCF